MGASIDLAKAHAARRYGDIQMILTWVNDERAMVLMPAFRKGAPWYIVCESAAWKYDDPKYLASQCAKAAEILGLEESTKVWVKLATIINEALPDLIRMPSAPLPDFLKANFGTMELRGDGQTITKQDIQIEKTGAEYA